MASTSRANNRSSGDGVIEMIHQNPAMDGAVGQPCTIFRVPLNLRKVDEEAFTPQVVSLGPYHRKKYPSLEEMEDRKASCRDHFLQRVPIPEGTNDLLTKMKELEHEARSFYSGRIDMDSDEFVEMLLLDGCFILEVLLHPRRVLETLSLYLLVSMDMIMLENQIPFVVLETLYSFTKDGNLENLLELVSGFVKDFFPDNIWKLTGFKPQHLLHQIHSWVIPSSATVHQSHAGRFSFLRLKERSKKDVSVESIPSAVQLIRVAGMKIVRKEDKGAPFELRYKDGVLEISQLKIYDHLRNLVALEHCEPSCGRYVTDYVYLVDRLINTPGDVALLHDEGVVVNGLGSDEEAAQLINSLSKNMAWDWEDNEFKQVFTDVNKRYRQTWSRWRNHLRSPLVILPLVAALLLLLFTGAQTIYSIISFHMDNDKSFVCGLCSGKKICCNCTAS